MTRWHSCFSSRHNIYSGWPWAFNLKYKKWCWQITIASALISPLTPIEVRPDYTHHDFWRSGAPGSDLTAAAGDGWWVVGSKLSFLSTLLEFSDYYHLSYSLLVNNHAPFYSAPSIFTVLRNLVWEIWFEKSGLSNLVREKWLTRKKGGFIP